MQTLDIGRLIRDAWASTWRYRFLWVLALFAGGAAGGTVSGTRLHLNGGHAWRGPWRPDGVAGSGASGVDASVARAFEDVARWVSGNLGLVAAAGVALLAIVVGLIVVWLIAQGGMAEATVELGTGRRTSLGRAWRAGAHLFWRYAGLWLSLLVLSMLVAAVVGSGVAFAAAVGALTGNPVATAAVALVVALPLVLVALACGAGISIVVAYAQRAIAAEDEGPLAALRSGWDLLRARPLESVLTWVVSLALAIGTGIAGALALLVAGGVLVGIGALLWSLAGMGAAVVTYAAVGVLALIVLGLAVAAVANTFFWNYWTLAYLRLTGRATVV
jgi:hypothetical protein